MTEYYKQPFNNTVPELVKVSNWEDDETKDEILTNVQEIASTVAAIEGNSEQTIVNTQEIKNFTKMISADLKTSNGLLQSITNKLS